MQTVVKKWGNSLALRLPQTMAADLKLEEGAAVSMTLEDHASFISQSAATSFTSTSRLRQERSRLGAVLPSFSRHRASTSRPGWLSCVP